jgi:glycosyltransferase involved in cell wall biosynthesis
MAGAARVSVPDPPQISPLIFDGEHPYWSVMIPTFNPRRDYLEQAIGSVISQGFGPEEMEIVVVDDCSTEVDVASLVESIAGSRVTFQRNRSNLGLAGCWNSCIERSRGEWIHILHQDDYVGETFYERLRELAELHPEVGLLATRSFSMDVDGVIIAVTSRVPSLENGGNVIEEFFYQTPILCPGVVVRRCCYEEVGGFREDLKFTLDLEMWTRAIKAKSGLVTSDVLAYYRIYSQNQSRRLWRSGEVLPDFAKLNAIFADKYEDFDAMKAHRKLMETARYWEVRMLELGEIEVARTCRRYWKMNAPIDFLFRVFVKNLIRHMSRLLEKLIQGTSKLRNINSQSLG